MPLTTYTAGEVLTAASLNANLSFAASSPAGGLTLIKTQTIGTTVSSVEVTGAFSTTYDTYFVTVSGGVASTSTIDLKLTLGSTVTGYNKQLIFAQYNNTATTQGSSNQSSFENGGTGNTSTLYLNCFLQNPFLTKPTIFNSDFISSAIAGRSWGYLDNSTSYTAFTLTTSSGTITGGTIRVYGYANS